jgi:hypothetical protein
MRFERELKPYAEPVPANRLREGSVYFSVTFVDEEMLIPTMETVVFIGRNLEPGGVGQLYFQDVDSHRRKIRYGAVAEDEHAIFFAGPENEINHIFEYERALELLMLCSLRRSEAPAE